MPKAIPLSDNDLPQASIAPQAATPQRGEATPSREKKVDHIAFQVRLPRDVVKAVKRAAFDQGKTLSAVVTECLRAHLPPGTGRN